ncbi:MAG: tyrosine-type recombinase/integrase [Treponema sp.]|nr:tyrosine-type recombinase/integrase [Treponema sp.]
MTLQTALSTVQAEQQRILYLRAVVEKEHPAILKALRLVDANYTAAVPAARPDPPPSPCLCSTATAKGYNLVKVKNKKLGFVYYVRYWHKETKKMLPSRWCTRTNDYEKAREYAVANRERLISGYLGKTGGEVVRFFERFYDTNNPVFQSESQRYEITEERRKRYGSIVKNKFVPFLLERKISEYKQIDVALLDDFQDLLLSKMKPKSVNVEMAAIGKPLRYLARKGLMKTNPYLSLPPVPESGGTLTRGCYDMEQLKGVFDKEWENQELFLLNLIIYSTGMRNSEIRRFSKDDIISTSGSLFIDLKDSKTENGIRHVPLHDGVYRHIMEYAQGTDSKVPVFGKTSKEKFAKAALDLGRMMGFSSEYLKEQKITFYSGRHAWKTLMSAGGLGEDIEEVFMGHKVSSDVAKLYNHRDKRGQQQLAKKARDVFRILDTMLFEKEG